MALQGTLDTFAIPDVLRLLSSSARTGRLTVEGPEESGGLLLVDGAIVDHESARPQTRTPVDTLFRLLRLTSGSFVFDADVTPETGGDPLDVEDAIERAQALVAEYIELEAVVTSPLARVSLRPVMEQDEVRLDRARWAYVAAIAGGATIDTVADVLGLSELEAMRTGRDLVELGIIHVAPPADPSPPSTPDATAAPVSDHRAGAEHEPESPFEIPMAGVEEPSVASRPAGPGPAEPLSTEPWTGEATAVESGPVEAASVEPEPVEAPQPPPSWATLPEAPPPGTVLPFDPAIRPTEPAAPAAAAPVFQPLPEVPTPADGGPAPELAPVAAAIDATASAGGAAVRSEAAEVARQLANLSPRAAKAVARAAKATTSEEREAALAEAEEADAGLDRGLLMKFLGSVD